MNPMRMAFLAGGDGWHVRDLLRADVRADRPAIRAGRAART